MNLFDFFRPDTGDDEEDSPLRAALSPYQKQAPQFDWSRLQDDTPDSTRPKLVDPRYTTPIAAVDAPVDSGRPVLQPMQQQAQPTPDQQPLQPLTDAPPPDAPMATRPRLVPPTYTPEQLASAEQNAQDVNTAVPELAAIGKAAKTGRDFTLSPLQEAQNKLSDLTDFQNNPVVNKGSVGPDGEMHKANFKGRLKDAAIAALLGASQQVQANGGRASLGTIGAAAGGLAGGAINPAWNEQRARLQDIARTENRVGQLQQQDKFASDQGYRQAQTANIYADNAQKAQDAIDKKDYQQQTLKERAEIADDRQTQLAIARISKKGYLDPKNPVDQALAKRGHIDLTDLEGYDDRSPILKKVAGATYRLNRQTGEFEPTNLPADESLALTPYDVQMPDGTTRTYQVPNKEAAKFAQQMKVVGANIQSRKDISQANIQSREKIAGSKDQVKRDVATQNNQVKTQLQADRAKYGQAGVLQRAQDAFVKEYQKANKNKMPSPQQIQDHLNNNVLPLLGN